MIYRISDIDRKNDRIRLNTKLKLERAIYGFNDFNNLTCDKREELRKEALNLRERFIKNDKIGLAYYNIIQCITFYDETNKHHNHKKYTPEETLSLLIETVDPNLRMLKIFMTSNTDFEIEKKANKLFGFYDPNLIDFEREYAKRFFKANRKEQIKKLKLEN